jgi:hypothetical protein
MGGQRPFSIPWGDALTGKGYAAVAGLQFLTEMARLQ